VELTTSLVLLLLLLLFCRGKVYTKGKRGKGFH
jgi:hypothetical protein